MARARPGGTLALAYEELPRTSPLSTPLDRVAYGYCLDSGSLRVHSGLGLGPVETARALLEDVVALVATEAVA